MRIDIKKFIFMGAVKDKASFYKEAQKLGAIEFIHSNGRRFTSYPPEVQKLTQAIKYIQSYVTVPQDTKKPIQEAAQIAEKILELKNRQGELLEQKRVLLQEISRIAPFGDFDVEKIKEIEHDTHLRFRFFLAKSSKQLENVIPELILINQRENVDYFIALSKEIATHQDLIEVHIQEPAVVLEKHLRETEDKLDVIHSELNELKTYSHLLHKALIHEINEVDLAHAQESSEFELENQLFFVEAWVPITDVEAIKTLAKKQRIYHEEVMQEETEKAPTYLKNEGVARVGEDVIRIFDVPANNDKDPSLWVLFAFTLFFSMIVFDAGYGLIFLATAMYVQFKLRKKKPTQQRMIILMTILALGCTIWGSMTHSFFGMTLDPNSFLRKHSFMTWLIDKKAAYHMQNQDSVYQDIVSKYPEAKSITDPHVFAHIYDKGATNHYPIATKFTDNILMELALFLGSLHIIVGLIRYLRQNPIGIGWIAFIIGSYLYIPFYLKASSLLYYVFGLQPEPAAHFGLQLLFVGLGLAALIAVIQHGFTGIFEGLHAIQVFGDVLSYLRIYALGTAAYIVAETVNHMAAKVPIFIAIFLLVFGHLINIILSVMGGTIHGLRLNFLEWYRYSFYGGGKNFQPLQLKTLE